jgi:peptide/nickel transport system substrate-binding protein
MQAWLARWFSPDNKKYMQKQIALLILFLTLSGISTACGSASQPPQNLVYGLTLSPSGIDPHINASAELGIPLSSVYDTLVFQDPQTGEFVPGLAKHWRISDDGLTYTFFLREDVTFHDGNPFNAQAVKANIDYIIHPDHHSQKAIFMLGPLDDVEILDDFTVAFRLKEPFAPLLDSLAQVYLGIASPAALEKWGPTQYQFHQVGTGPYRFVEYVPNDHLTLEKFSGYAWAPSVYEQSSAQIDQIVFKFYEDPATRGFALERGEVSIIGEVPPHEAERLASNQDFDLHPIPIPGQPLQFFFNTELSPTDDRQVRQALTLAIDRAAIVETVFGQHSPVAQAPLSSSLPMSIKGPPFPNFNPNRASKLLDKAGWQREGEDGNRFRDDERLVLHVVAPPWGSNPEVAQLIQAAWEEIGAEVHLKIAPGFGPLKETQAEGQYHAIGLNFFGTDPDLLQSFYHSQSLYNWTGYQDPQVDALLEQAAQETHNAALRRQYYAKLYKIIRDQALVIPIREYVNLVVVRAEIQGLHFSSQGWFPSLIDLGRAP